MGNGNLTDGELRVPYSYQNRVSLRCRGFYGGGELSLVPGKIEVRPGAAVRLVTRKEEAHWDSPIVHLVCPRLTPPWYRFSLLLEDSCVAIFSSWERRDLEEALKQAGFTVQVHRTWIGFGGRRILSQGRG